ncbi:protein tweety homolog 2-like isoform X3 [Tubulanus polymorphus]|uniref:protein tweety homolog 2-like isoform X3 n=1 Tax=Tubulanus polymorphus TaxID=672921 RepID=UPI003DA4123F
MIMAKSGYLVTEDSWSTNQVQQYEVQWLANFFHSFPHVNLSFTLTDSTFDPQNSSYQESLLFLSCLPLVWMVLTMIGFIAYFCYRCCQPDPTPKKQVRGRCLKWTLAVLLIVTGAATGVGFLGNEKLHQGIETSADAAESGNLVFQGILSNVYTLETKINSTLEKNLKPIEDSVNKSSSLSLDPPAKNALLKTIKSVKDQANSILNSITNINKHAKKVDIQKFVDYTRQYEFYRWVALIGLFCLLVIICLLYLLSVGKSSKCLIISCTCVAVFYLFLSWIVTGAFLGTAMATGDFCVDPDEYIRSESNAVDQGVMEYYMNCDGKVNPFSNELRKSQDSMREIVKTSTKLFQDMKSFFKKAERQKIKANCRSIRTNMDESVGVLQQLTAAVDCHGIHKAYVDMLNGVCHTGLAGLGFLVVAGIGLGILLSDIIIIASRVWRYFGIKVLISSTTTTRSPNGSMRRFESRVDEEFTEKEYCTIDEDDPFIPRASNSPSYHSWLYSGSQNNTMNSGTGTSGRFSPGMRLPGSTRHTGPEHLPLHGRQTPPPAYGDFGYEDHYNSISRMRGNNAPVDV